MTIKTIPTCITYRWRILPLQKYFIVCNQLSRLLEFLTDDWISVSSLWALVWSFRILINTFKAFATFCFFTRNLGVSCRKSAHRVSTNPIRISTEIETLQPNVYLSTIMLITMPAWIIIGRGGGHYYILQCNFPQLTTRPIPPIAFAMAIITPRLSLGAISAM